MASAGDRFKAIAAQSWIYAGRSVKLLNTDLSTAETNIATLQSDVATLKAGGTGGGGGVVTSSVVYSATTTRPTTRTDVMCVFTGSDPGSNALDGDLWLR